MSLMTDIKQAIEDALYHWDVFMYAKPGATKEEIEVAAKTAWKDICKENEELAPQVEVNKWSTSRYNRATFEVWGRNASTPECQERWSIAVHVPYQQSLRSV